MGTRLVIEGSWEIKTLKKAATSLFALNLTKEKMKH